MAVRPPERDDRPEEAAMFRARGWRRWFVHLLAGTLTALGALAVAPTAYAADPDPGLLSPCRYRSGFGGSYYCQVAVKDVTSTRFGTGRRVYVTGTISAATDTTMTVAEVHVRNTCPPGSYCAPTLEVWFEKLTVTTPGWSGVRRPPLGYLVRLYGTTTSSGSLTAVGYIKSTYCGPTYELCL